MSARQLWVQSAREEGANFRRSLSDTRIGHRDRRNRKRARKAAREAAENSRLTALCGSSDSDMDNIDYEASQKRSVAGMPTTQRNRRNSTGRAGFVQATADTIARRHHRNSGALAQSTLDSFMPRHARRARELQRASWGGPPPESTSWTSTLRRKSQHHRYSSKHDHRDLTLDADDAAVNTDSSRDLGIDASPRHLASNSKHAKLMTAKARRRSQVYQTESESSASD